MATRHARRAQRHANRPLPDVGPLRVAVGLGPPVVTDPGAKVSSRHERMAAGADQLAVLARARAAARRVTSGA